MWIKNQRGTQIINISGYDRIGIKDNEDSWHVLGIKETFINKMHLLPAYTDFGSYKSEESALRVVSEIYKYIADGTTFYSMPTE